MKHSLNNIVAINTLSSYALVAIRIVYVVFITRFLYRALGDNYYGFWSILWAFFTYVVVFNFGFGATIQKYTAERLFDSNFQKYNKIISFIFSFYLFSSLIICAISVLAIVYIEAWVNIDDKSVISNCRIALAIFTFGIATLFPLSIFSDILTGLRLIYLKNFVMGIMRFVEMIGIYLLISSSESFISIVLFSVSTNVIFAALLIFVVRKNIPSFALTSKLDFGVFKEIRHFSLFVYLNSLATLIMTKTDRFILSSILGLPAVSFYQIGTRLPDMAQTLSSQFQDNVIPVAAELAKKGDKRQLKDILVKGMRFSVFASMGATALFFAMTEEIIKVLFDINSDEITFICRAILISQMFYCSFRNVPYRYLQVVNKYKFIAIITCIQAVSTVLAGIFLCKTMGLSGIVWAALIPNIICSTLIIFPIAAKFLDLKTKDFIDIFFKPILSIILPVALCIVAKQYFLDELNSLFYLTILLIVASVSYLISGWIIALYASERKLLYLKILEKYRKCFSI